VRVIALVSGNDGPPSAAGSVNRSVKLESELILDHSGESVALRRSLSIDLSTVGLGSVSSLCPSGGKATGKVLPTNPQARFYVSLYIK